MTLDVLTRLSGTTGSSAAGQSIAAATAAAPVYSTNWIDLDAGGSLRTKRDLCDLFALVWPTTTVDSATNNATLDIELVMAPTTTPATNTQTFTAATTDIITATAHGLIDGTRITVSSSTTLPGGLASSTNYYLRDTTTNTFKVSTTPGGTAVDITDTGTGTHTLTWYPEVVGAASKVPLERLIANRTQVQIRINPLLLDSRVQPVHRYLFARYVPTANLSAGVVFCDLQRGAPMSNHPINPSNYVTP
jgi:hypothetical protein